MNWYETHRMLYWVIVNLLTESQLDVEYHGRSLRKWAAFMGPELK